MSEEQNKPQKQDVSRRQFLNYTLMGVGAFMAAGALTPMLRFAIDPVLKTKAEQDMVAVGDISQFGPEPTPVNFTLKIQDAWAEYDMVQTAWVTVSGAGEVLALSPICKHLGCTVQWDTHDPAPDHYYCPCHDGLYTKDGVNVPGTPPMGPLDVYRYHIDESGTLYLGAAVPREEL